MTPNGIISKRRGECRHEAKPKNPKYSYPIFAYKCKHCDELIRTGREHNTDYSDPAAWTPELYDWIEGEGLKNHFIHMLWIELVKNGKKNMEFQFMRTTPEQKALALSRAIEESE